MNSIDYAVVIRTLGEAGEKYQRLLDSIDRLEPKPKEVIVVLPKGYEIPKEKLGYEKFVFSNKGMVEQRVCGLKQTNCKYILFCDDDVSFDTDYINKLYEPIREGIADATVGPLLDFLPKKGITSIVAMLLGGAVPSIYNKTNYTTILRNSGWSYNRINLSKCKKYYNTQSAAGTNFFIKRDVMIKLNFGEESWIEKFKYAAIEDQTMFYKLYKMGYKTVVVSDAIYNHEDAKTSFKELKLEPIYATGFNHYIFWHRFIYSLSKNNINKLIDKICFNHWYVSNSVYLSIRKGKEVSKVFRNGVKNARKYIETNEYKQLTIINEVKKDK